MTVYEKVIAYEQDELNDLEIVEFFQELIDSGIAWKLQGHYGRMAMNLVDSGYCTLSKENV